MLMQTVSIFPALFKRAKSVRLPVVTNINHRCGKFFLFSLQIGLKLSYYAKYHAAPKTTLT